MLGVAALMALQACGAASVTSQQAAGSRQQDLPVDGRAAKVVCPNIQKSAWLIEGAFVNVNQLCTVAAGAGRNQLCHLLGRPHFMEGFGLVREWDYIFNLHAGKGSEFVTCQYKMVFDKNALAQSFHWAPADCANQLTPKPLAVVEKLVIAPKVLAAPVGVGTPRRVSLSAYALVAFKKSALADLQPGGKREFDALAKSVNQGGTLEAMDVVGYSDRLGAEDYNQRLSQARARTLRDNLMLQSMPADKMSVKGVGEQGAMVQCGPTARAALVAYLTPTAG